MQETFLESNLFLGMQCRNEEASKVSSRNIEYILELFYSKTLFISNGIKLTVHLKYK